ncbi:hypothetical protein BKA69DRAFT_1066960 [Paraphysoderma sedebokerense]|nr:hypothetical protein BKA69DRAFT_1066960 [Paraphysoderma sedebokerense]
MSLNSKLLLLALATMTFTDMSSAHFTLFNSRESLIKSPANARFWPVGGAGEHRPGPNDCLALSPNSPRSVSAGSTLALNFEIGNSAAHVGPCKGGLYDRQTKTLVNDLGTIENCVSSGAVFNAKIPSNPGCSECVIKVEVKAMHNPSTPEFYDSCVDVNIGGGAGGSYGSIPQPAKVSSPIPSSSYSASPSSSSPIASASQKAPDSTSAASLYPSTTAQPSDDCETDVPEQSGQSKAPSSSPRATASATTSASQSTPLVTSSPSYTRQMGPTYTPFDHDPNIEFKKPVYVPPTPIEMPCPSSLAKCSGSDHTKEGPKDNAEDQKKSGKKERKQRMQEKFREIITRKKQQKRNSYFFDCSA